MCYSLWYNAPTMFPAGNIVGALYHKLYTQSSAPEDGRIHRPKHLELIGIINKPLLLHLVGCLYYLYQWCRSNIKNHVPCNACFLGGGFRCIVMIVPETASCKVRHLLLSKQWVKYYSVYLYICSVPSTNFISYEWIYINQIYTDPLFISTISGYMINWFEPWLQLVCTTIMTTSFG